MVLETLKHFARENFFLLQFSVLVDSNIKSQNTKKYIYINKPNSVFGDGKKHFTGENGKNFAMFCAC